ncbi:MAG: translocation/assembly module TamB domain-containing protein [Nitrospinae bacterium]|nr:translocation/assembly module TamB domain-containing protein [Nitrospinota bacterium]
MRFSAKMTAFVMLLALGVAGATVLYVTKDRLVALGVRWGVDAYNTRLNSTLTIQDASVDLLTLTATVRGISIAERVPTSQEAPLQVKQATATVRLWPLLKKKVVVEDVHVSEAVVRYEVDAENRMNLEELFRLRPEADSGKPSPWNVSVPRFELHQAMVNVFIEGQPVRTALSGVAIQGSFSLLPRHLHVELTNGRGEVTYHLGREPLKVHLLGTTASFDLFKDRLRIEGLRVAAEEFTLTGHGMLENARIAAEFDVDVPLAIVAAFIAELPPPVGTVAVKGSLAGSVKSPQLRLTVRGEQLGVGAYTVSELTGAMALVQARLQIERFTLGFSGGTLRGAGSLGLGQPQPQQPRIDVQVEMTDLPIAEILPLAGITTPLLSGRLAGHMSIVSPSFDPHLMRVQGSLKLSPPALRAPDASQPFSQPIFLSASFRYEDRTIVLEQTAWALNGAKGEVSGTLKLDGAAQLSGTAQADLGAQTFGRLGVPRIQGEVRLTFGVHGNLREPGVEADIEVRNASYQGIRFDRLQMVLKGEQSDVKIISLSGAQGSARFHLAGDVKLAAPLTHLRLTSAPFPIQAIPELFVHVERLDLGMLAPLLPAPVPLAGQLTLQAKAAGSWPTLDGEGHLEIRGLVVRGEPLGDVSMVVEGSPAQARLKQLVAAIGGGQVRAKGTMTFPRQIDLTVEWQGVDLAHLAHLQGMNIAVAGALNGTVKARGAWPELNAEVAIQGPRLTAYGMRIADLQARAVASPRGLILERFTTRVGGARLTASGRIAWVGPIELRLTSDDIPLRGLAWLPEGYPVMGRAKLDLQGSGMLANPTVRGHARLTGVRAGGWTIGTGDLTFSLEDRRVTFSTVGLERFSINGWMMLEDTLPAQVRLAVHSLDLGLVTAQFPGASKGVIEGEVSGTSEVSGQLRSLPTVLGSVVLERLRIRSNDVELHNIGPLRWQFAKGVLAFEAVRLGGQGANLEVQGTVNLVEERLALAVQGVTPLAIIGTRIPGLRFYQGTVDTRVNLRGQLRQPSFDGQVLLRDGVIAIPAMNESLSQLKGEIQFSEQTVAIQSLAGKLAGGDIQISGELSLVGFQLHQMSLTAQANQVRLRYPADFSALLNAEVLITGNSEAQQVTGEISLARARFRQELDVPTLLLRYRRRELEPPTLARESPHFDLRVYTTDPLHVDNRLAKVELTADLNLRGSPNQPLLLGRVELEKGTANVAGSQFTNLTGSVDFLNPQRTEAFFDIAADVQKRGYRIHTTATGTPEQFDLHLTSEPPLGEEDILGLLAVGATGQAVATGASAILPARISSFLSGQFAEEIGRGVGGFVGVDRFEIEPLTGGAQRVGGPKVTVGKNLTKDLSVTYTTTFGPTRGSTREDVASVEYRITDNISLLGVRDEKGDVGVDFKFSFRFE